EVRSDMRRDGANAIMARRAAARLHADLSGFEVEFVVEDDDIGRRQLVEAHRLADGAPAFVHVCRGLHFVRLLTTKRAFGHQSLKARAGRRKGMAANDRVRRHESEDRKSTRLNSSHVKI